MILNGIDNIEKYKELFKNKRLGLVTNHTGVNINLERSIDIINKLFDLKCLYSPEHGISGKDLAGDNVNDCYDIKTKLKVYSLYGDNKELKEYMLKDIDLIVFDIQDIGSRYYTYIYTLSYVMEACAKFNKELIILDRVNFLGGNIVEGNILKEEYTSFVGRYKLPVRYGLTVGELAIYLNDTENTNCKLKIIPLSGWNREMINNPYCFINPSPNINSIDSIILYNGTCLFEGTNISEGRGTTLPFQIIIAPWIDGDYLADIMNKLNLPDVIFRPINITPTTSKYSGQLCSGVQIHITNRENINAINISYMLLAMIKKIYNKKLKFINSPDIGNDYFINYLFGDNHEKISLENIDRLISLNNKELE